MADNNASMGANDRFCIIRRDANGVGTAGSVPESVARAGIMDTQASIANIANDANGTAIATAVNGILAALRTNNVLLPPE